MIVRGVRGLYSKQTIRRSNLITNTTDQLHEFILLYCPRCSNLFRKMDELELPKLNNGTPHKSQLQTEVEETLNSYQILLLVWMIVCIAPNLILIYIILKKHLQDLNFYFVLMNWCISNIICILCLFYFHVVPEKYIDYMITDKLYVIHIILPALTMLLVTLFMFQSFLYSDKFCTGFLYMYWCVFVLFTIAEIICSELEYVFIVELFFIIAPLKVLCVIVLIIRIFMQVVMPQNDDEHAILRICMAGAYILAYFVFWLLQILIITEVIIGSFFLFIMYATYINGFVNIVLLIYFDPSTKWYFYALFGKYGRQISTTDTNRDATKPYCLESTV